MYHRKNVPIIPIPEKINPPPTRIRNIANAHLIISSVLLSLLIVFVLKSSHPPSLKHRQKIL